ncbi:hypothetical protein K7X08_017457 [Anisodus acutangulus]|uniref:Uncharacterized protein n=1 Tax=Anisodus acutangulus TaxID=402998 RepID=A0A9Q1R6D4_9SOLA|nr:hypothetical protein K7X08_017457 [Anisodus acutangulus]
MDTQSEDLGGNSLTKGDGRRFGIGTSRVHTTPRYPSVQVEQEGLQQRVEKMELNILVAFVEEKILRMSETEKKKKLETFKVQTHVVQPTVEAPRPADEVKNVEVLRPAAEVKEVDVPSQAVDVAKIELPRPTADVLVPTAKVVKENDVLAQVIFEEVGLSMKKSCWVLSPS